MDGNNIDPNVRQNKSKSSRYYASGRYYRYRNDYWNSNENDFLAQSNACYDFYKNDFCKYGNKCKFAHISSRSLTTPHDEQTNSKQRNQDYKDAKVGSSVGPIYENYQNYQMYNQGYNTQMLEFPYASSQTPKKEVYFDTSKNFIPRFQKKRLESNDRASVIEKNQFINEAPRDMANSKIPDYYLLKCISFTLPEKNFDLNDYISKNRLEITEMFFNEKLKLDEKRQEVFNHDYTMFHEENEAIDSEEQLLFKHELSFNKEMKRLESIMCHEKNYLVLKNAFDREFRRAKQKLPIYGYRDEILDKLKTDNIVVLVGLTGSGKSTQIVQYLLENGINTRKKIVCTEPRKVACISLAKRISEELGIEEDTLVTYKVGRDRYGNKTGDTRYEILRKSKLILMPDKLLLNEYRKDKMLSKYSCVIIDEAHERSVFSDILLAELKNLVEIRKKQNDPLKLIIMSATIDYDKFSKYFDNCPVINVPGQMYPVMIYYEKMKQNYLDQAVDKVKYIIKNKTEHPGDILVFFTSYEEIMAAIKKTEKYVEEIGQADNYICLPLYGKMEVDEQSKVFSPYNNKTKIIYATNVAETSITIDGIKTVIDTGRARERIFDQGCNISLIKLNLISQSSAIQRKGRAGRTSIGVCYRLYEQSDFDQMDFISQPEIFRLNLGLVILQILSCDITDILNYDLIDKPNQAVLIQALQKLISLQFVDCDMKITENGRIAAEMYLEPSISRFILEGVNLEVAYEMTVIAAMLSVSNILFQRSSTKEEKNIGILEHSNLNGDLITMLDMYNKYASFYKYQEKLAWCRKSFLSLNAFQQAEQTFTELWSTVKKTKNFSQKRNNKENKDEINKRILKAICASMHINLAYYNGRTNKLKVYKIVELNQEAYIHPSSCLSVLDDLDKKAEFILFTDIVRTDKLYIKNITPVDIEMIKEFTSYDLDRLKECVKEQVNVDVNPVILDYLKSNNNQLIEAIEAKIGYVLTTNSHSIIIDVPKCDKEKTLNVINESIESAKQALLNDVYESNPESYDNVRLIIGKGLKTHAILLNREYLRLNVYDIDVALTERDIEKEFEKFGKVLTVRINRSVVSRAAGYVVMNDIASAQDAFQYLTLHKKALFNIVPSASIEGGSKFSKAPLLQATYFLTKPKGKAFLTFKTNDDLRTALLALQHDGYAANINPKDPLLQLVVYNSTKGDVYMDEIKFHKYVSRFARLESCVLVRDPVPESKDVVEQYAHIESLFSQFGKIENLFILSSSMNKEGTFKPKVNVHIKYKEYQSAIVAVQNLDAKTAPFSYGIFHVHIKHKHEIRIPNQVYQIFKEDIEKLKRIVRLEFNCETVINEIKESKNLSNLIIVKCNEIQLLKQAIKLFNELLEPKILVLPYYKYDKLRKQLNQNDYQGKIQKENDIFILKDARYNQIKIYGKKREQVGLTLLNNLDEICESITIQLNSFKSIIGSDNLNKLKKEFRGDIKCDFRNKTITFISKASQVKQFVTRVKEIERYFSMFNKVSKKENACNICYSETEDPYHLVACNHMFCLECIKAQLNSFDMTNATLECVAKDCGSPFTIADIKKIAGYNNRLIDQKSSISMNNYLLKTNEYKNCNACDDLCRVSGTNFYCERCDKHYCVKCKKVDHPGLSCKESEKGMLDKYLDKHTKKCPKCNLNIEKSSGCNHMTCTQCQTHFCWICLEVCESSTIYDHLREKHGGID